MTMLAWEANIPFQMFYTDNMYYMDMMGMKMKQEMPLDEALDQVASNTGERGYGSGYDEEGIGHDHTEDGNTVLTVSASIRTI